MATDPIVGPNYGSADAVLAFATAQGAERPDQVAAFVREVYRLGALLGWDAFTLCAQSALETGNWRSPHWAERLNPGAIGVTDGWDQGLSWASGTDAARAFLVHHAAYVLGGLPAVLAPYEALDPRYGAVFAAGYAKSVVGWEDYGGGKWATDRGYGAKVVSRRLAMKQHEVLTFGKVPHPPFQDRPIAASTAWNDLGPRTIVGTCVHRMQGNLWGTDQFFRTDAPYPHGALHAALTDYGIGGSRDGADDGTILRWNDPRGRRSPWANGNTAGLEGDGPAFVNTFGTGAVNRDLVSIELSGFGNDPVSPKQFERLCQLVAHWHDQAGVPWYAFPLHPAHGVVTQMQHWEFTNKGWDGPDECPGRAVRGLTHQYQARTREIMRERQEPKPEPPAPTARPQVTAVNGVAFYRVGGATSPRTVVVRRTAKLRRWATTSSPEVGAVAADQPVSVHYWVLGEAVEGEPLWFVLDGLDGPRLWAGATDFRPQ